MPIGGKGNPNVRDDSPSSDDMGMVVRPVGITALLPSVQTEDTPSAGGETGTLPLGVRNDTGATKTSNDGDFSAIATDAAGRVGIADLGGSITVDGTVSVSDSSSVDTATVSRIAVGSGAAVTVLAANPLRKGYHVQSEFANGQLVYLKEGATASATDATAELQPGGAHEPSVNYRGIVTAIAASGTQNLKVTEY